MDKRLFGAVITANLIDINEGKVGDFVKSTWSKVPTAVKHVGSSATWVGTKVAAKGKRLEDFGTSKVNSNMNVSPNISGHIAKGAGVAIKKTGDAVGTVGNAIKGVGEGWQHIRDTAQQNKKEFEEKQIKDNHEKELDKIQKAHELKFKQKQGERVIALDDAKTIHQINKETSQRQPSAKTINAATDNLRQQDLAKATHEHEVEKRRKGK